MDEISRDIADRAPGIALGDFPGSTRGVAAPGAAVASPPVGNDPDRKRPRALDLFCKAGGASMGLHRAGFDVVGIDIEPQPNYPFAFIQADALRPPVNLADFDFIWASPPCQHASVGAKRWIAAGRSYPNLIAATRDLLSAHHCTTIENVPGAVIRPDLVLTGDMFGLPTYRRRHFELSFFCMAPFRGRPFGPKTRAGSFTAAGNGGHGPNRPRLWAAGMGVEWMVQKAEISHAVPPVYSEFIGRAAMRALLPVGERQLSAPGINAAVSGEVVSEENMLALHASNITGGESECRHASWVVALPK